MFYILHMFYIYSLLRVSRFSLERKCVNQEIIQNITRKSKYSAESVLASIKTTVSKSSTLKMKKSQSE